MSCLRLFITAACMLASAGVALGQEGKPGREKDGPRRGVVPSQLFERLDGNKDGHIDRAEMPPKMRERFEKMDADGDGKISREELEKAAVRFGKQPARRPGADGPPDLLFRLLDSNNDGKLSREELDNASRLLKKLDRNKNGTIERDELRPQKGRGGRPGEIITPAARGERLKDRLKKGDRAPDFTLPELKTGREIRLSSFQGEKPVVLIFASYT